MTETVETPVEAAQNAQVQGVVIQKKIGISVGSCIRGIDIRMHWSMFLFTIISIIAPRHGDDNWWLTALFYFLVYGPIMYLTILVHELGHAYVTSRLGGEVTELVLWPCGGLTITGPKDGSARDDVKSAIAGPLFHIPMMIVWFLTLWLCFSLNGDDNIPRDISESSVVFIGNVAYEAFRLNAILVLANVCIPMFPFDAIRIVGGLVLIAGINVSVSAKITASVGIIVGGFIGILGVYLYGFLFGLAEVLFGLVLMGSSVSLYRKANDSERLRSDIIFGRPCFNNSNDGDHTGESTPESSTNSVESTDGPFVTEIV